MLQYALTIQFFSGCFKNAEFPFDVDQDTSLSVAIEMVEDFELPQGNIQIIAQVVEASCSSRSLDRCPVLLLVKWFLRAHMATSPNES